MLVPIDEVLPDSEPVDVIDEDWVSIRDEEVK